MCTQELLPTDRDAGRPEDGVGTAGEPPRTHWRLRVVVDDARGRLAALAMTLSRAQANVSSVHVHPLPGGGAMDELLLSMPEGTSPEEILHAARRADARDAAVWPVDVKAFVDEPTRVLRLASQAARAPELLPEVLAELLHARLVAPAPGGDDRLVLHPPVGGPVVLERDGEPLPPAEQARAEALCAVVSGAFPSAVGPLGAVD